MILSSGTGPDLDPRPAVAEPAGLADRGIAEGVSSKSSGAGSRSGLLGSSGPYPWTNKMLAWQRTGFHFQPEKNWMNGTQTNHEALLAIFVKKKKKSWSAIVFFFNLIDYFY